MRHTYVALLLAAIALGAPAVAFAEQPADGPQQAVSDAAEQEQEQDAPLLTVQPVKVALNADGSSYLRLLTWHQLWVRAMELNPGTTVNGNPTDDSFDVGIRRSRFLALAQFDRTQLVFHFGFNNQTFNNQRKPQVFVHDVWGSYDVAPGYLTVGAGLHYWKGISRLSNASTLNFLALDAPIFNWATIERTDQFARQLGLFAKGQINRLDYRFAVNRPFSTSRELVAGGPADYDANANSLALAGYTQWFFQDKESNLLPYTVGSYLGKKRVLNVGAGFHYNPNAMGTLSMDGSTVDEHDILAVAVDVFADQPLGDGFAFTGYAGLFRYDFGPDHLRSIGIMNIGAGGDTMNGPGNAYPSIGTGDTLYLQAGLLIPANRRLEIQPYGTLQASWFEALDDVNVVGEAGANWLLQGHRSKVTTHFRSRPVFAQEGDQMNQVKRAAEFIMQFHVFL